MRRNAGFTLVEAMVVVAILAMVITFAIPAFSTWHRRQDAEGEISRFYNDIQYARMKAYSEKTVWGIWWGSSSTFSSYYVKKDGNANGDINDSSGTDVIMETVAPKRGLTTTNTTTNRLEFDGRGFSKYLATFYVPSSYGAAQDCLTVSRTRIILGKWNGTSCTPK